MSAVPPFKLSESNTPYYTNPFKTTCLHFLLQYPDMTFKEYQRKSGDFQCLQSKFEEVKQDIQVWPELQARVIKPKYTNLTIPNGEVKTQPAVEVERSVANQIALPEPPRHRKKLDVDLKKIMEDAIIAEPGISYEQLQAKNPWPEFEKANFYSMVAYLRMAGSIPPAESKRGRELSPTMARVRLNMEKLTYKQLEELTLSTYARANGHHIAPYQFSQAKKWAMNQIKPPIPREKKAQEIAEVKAEVVERRRAFHILPEVSLDGVPEDQLLTFKRIFNNFIQSSMKQAVQRPGSVKVNLLIDPPRLEIMKEVFV